VVLTPERLTERQNHRDLALVGFHAEATAKLGTCLGAARAPVDSAIQVTFRRVPGQVGASTAPDVFQPVGFAAAQGALGPDVQRCLDQLRATPLHVQKSELAEEEFFSAPVALPVTLLPVPVSPPVGGVP